MKEMRKNIFLKKIRTSLFLKNDGKRKNHFSSPEPKAMFVFCRPRRCCKLFIYSSSSLKLLGIFQLNLAQNCIR